jgi:hypothetical protein
LYASIRTYDGNPELADQLGGYRGDIEQLLGSIPGFRHWVCVRTDNGTVTVTVCDDKAGVEESITRAGNWLKEHASDVTFTTPEIANGEITMELGVTAKV